MPPPSALAARVRAALAALALLPLLVWLRGRRAMPVLLVPFAADWHRPSLAAPSRWPTALALAGATPLREITELNIGSRPASRKATQAIEDLRAIPWGFSWGQCRLTLPGWYGFGTAVHAFLDETPGQTKKQGLAILQKMYRQWPFFRTLLSNMDMVLAKSDLALASLYAELVPQASLMV